MPRSTDGGPAARRQARAPRRRLTPAGLLANLALAALSLVLFWAAFDLLAFPALLPRTPLNLQPEFREPAIRTLAQSSKRGAVPRGPWIALAGDSYAAGQGDWFLGVDHDSNPPFHSAHVLYETTGRDVVSFGHAGAGSLRGLVSEPLGQLAYLRRTLRFRPADPADLLIYFFEGNDLSDNLEDLRRRFDPVYGREKLRDPEVFHAFLEEHVLGEAKPWRQAEGFRLRENFFLLRTVRYAVARRLRGGEGAAAGDQPLARAREAKTRAEPETHLRNHLRTGADTVGLGRALTASFAVLGEGEVDDALTVFEGAARFLAAHLPETRFHVVYIPSPATVYEYPDGEVRIFASFFRERDGVYVAEAVYARSDAVCRRVAAFAHAEGLGFVDTRAALRAATGEGPIHGPADWRHLNRRGYEVLGEAVAGALGGDAGGTCARLSRTRRRADRAARGRGRA